VSSPRELLPRNGTPDTIAGWKTLADGFLTDQACAFHRNVEISSRYAWMYRPLPGCLTWAGMAAIASRHVRLALVPLRLDTDRTGYVNLPSSLGRQEWLLMEDVHAIRETNNGIFDDIFWAHLAYVSAVLEDETSGAEDRRAAAELIWSGNVQLFEHAQRALVRPHFHRLSCAFARLYSLGSATSFEARQAYDGRRPTSPRSTCTR
jgi:hypothetical protein